MAPPHHDELLHPDPVRHRSYSAPAVFPSHPSHTMSLPPPPGPNEWYVYPEILPSIGSAQPAKSNDAYSLHRYATASGPHFTTVPPSESSSPSLAPGYHPSSPVGLGHHFCQGHFSAHDDGRPPTPFPRGWTHGHERLDPVESEPTYVLEEGESPYNGSSGRSVSQPGQTPPSPVYECTICHRPFTRKQALQSHYVTHTGKRPYPCPIVGCQKAFSTSSNCKRHARTHTRSEFRRRKTSAPVITNTGAGGHGGAGGGEPHAAQGRAPAFSWAGPTMTPSPYYSSPADVGGL